MHARPILRSILTLTVSIFLGVSAAHAQPCEPAWAEGVAGVPGTWGTVTTLARWDDGTGQALYAGGSLSVIGTQFSRGIGRFDGERWSVLADGMGGDFRGPVNSMMVFDDGSGEALYVGGGFDRIGDREAFGIGRWDGHAWSPVGDGLSGRVRAMAVFDDGTGPALYAGGEFIRSGSREVGSLARWDGTQWVQADSVNGQVRGTVRSLVVYDGALYVGGDLMSVGGPLVGRVARWDGDSWTEVGGRIGFFLSDNVRAMCWHDDGTGPALYATGTFLEAGGAPVSHIARWDGTHWTALGAGIDGTGLAIASVRTGDGPRLVVTGLLSQAGGVDQPGYAAWDGATWGPLPGGVAGRGATDAGSALLVVDDGPTDALYMGGRFDGIERTGAVGVGLWRDGQWRPLGPWLGGGISPYVAALIEHDEGSGPAVYAGGQFWAAGGEAAGNVARWDGQAWRPIGSELASGQPLEGVQALASFDDGSGATLFAAGNFQLRGDRALSAAARWNGAAWEPLGVLQAIGGGVAALATFDRGDGLALYAAGTFSVPGAGGSSANFARWNGTTWEPVGGGVQGTVADMVAHDDGGGPALYLIGNFVTRDGSDLRNLVRWDGVSWSDVGGEFSPSGSALLSADGLLYAGGSFSSIGGVPAASIAVWDGAAWSPLGEGVVGTVNSMAMHNDGSGPAFYAGGRMTTAGGQPVLNIARWDGVRWTPLGPGLGESGDFVIALCSHEAATGSTLFAGGTFFEVDGRVAPYIAQWGCGTIPCPADLDADGELTIFDFLAFQNAFDAMDPVADFDGDGAFTIFDFLAFQNEFDAGC